MRSKLLPHQVWEQILQMAKDSAQFMSHDMLMSDCQYQEHLTVSLNGDVHS